MSHRTRGRPVLHIRAGRLHPDAASDTVAHEEPLELRLDGRVLTTTMRTPGEDVDLAHGWLLAEGIVTAVDDVVSARFNLGVDGDDGLNVLDVVLADEVDAPPAARVRLGTTTASCGICGTSAVDAMTLSTSFPADGDPTTVAADVVLQLPDRLRAGQHLFEQTGGTHGAALATPDGSILAVREDVGRHNAVDKVLGWALQHGQLPLAGRLLVLSGRAGFELVQKAAMAGVPVVAAVGAPTALAVATAEAAGITLVGFVRGDHANVYTRADRIVDARSTRAK